VEVEEQGQRGAAEEDARRRQCKRIKCNCPSSVGDGGIIEAWKTL
jgi:hypothetical protein